MGSYTKLVAGVQEACAMALIVDSYSIHGLVVVIDSYAGTWLILTPLYISFSM